MNMWLSYSKCLSLLVMRKGGHALELIVPGSRGQAY